MEPNLIILNDVPQVLGSGKLGQNRGLRRQKGRGRDSRVLIFAGGRNLGILTNRSIYVPPCKYGCEMSTNQKHSYSYVLYDGTMPQKV